MKKFSLKDFVEKVDWQLLYNARYSGGLPQNAVAISFVKSKKDKEYADYVRIRFGIDILKQMEWLTGDKLTVLYDPDDVLSLLILKRDEGGRTLQKEVQGAVHYMQLKWDSEIKFQVHPSRIIEHEIYRQYLHIQIPNNLR